MEGSTIVILLVLRAIVVTFVVEILIVLEAVPVVRDVFDAFPDGPDGDDPGWLSFVFESRPPLGDAVSLAPRLTPLLPIHTRSPGRRAAEFLAPLLYGVPGRPGGEGFDEDGLSPPVSFAPGRRGPEADAPGDGVDPRMDRDAPHTQGSKRLVVGEGELPVRW